MSWLKETSLWCLVLYLQCWWSWQWGKGDLKWQNAWHRDWQVMFPQVVIIVTLSLCLALLCSFLLSSLDFLQFLYHSLYPDFRFPFLKFPLCLLSDICFLFWSCFSGPFHKSIERLFSYSRPCDTVCHLAEYVFVGARELPFEAMELLPEYRVSSRPTEHRVSSQPSTLE